MKQASIFFSYPNKKLNYHEKSGHKITLIYLLMFIIKPNKGCDERAITSPLPAIKIKKTATCKCGSYTNEVQMEVPQPVYFYLDDTTRSQASDILPKHVTQLFS